MTTSLHKNCLAERQQMMNLTAYMHFNFVGILLSFGCIESNMTYFVTQAFDSEKTDCQYILPLNLSAL